MRLIKILLSLAFYPSWSSAITAEENAKLVDDLEKAQKEASEVHFLDLSKNKADKQKAMKEYDAKLANVMKATNALQKAIMDDIKREEKVDENEIEENSTISFTPGMVDEVLKALKTAGASSDDFLKDLNELGPKLAAFMKAAIPIGDLTSRKQKPKPESDEYKALIDFKNRRNVIWNDIRSQKPSKQYDYELDRWIRHITSLTNRSFDASIGKGRGNLDVFGNNCRTSPTRPKAVMEYLKSHLVTECGDPITTKNTEEKAKQRRHYKEIIRRVFRLFKVKPIPEHDTTIPIPSGYLSSFIWLYKFLDKKFRIERMDVFRREFSSHEDAFKTFTTELNKRAKIYLPYKKGCLIHPPPEEIHGDEETFNHTRISLLTRKLHMQLVETAFNAAICSRVMFSDRSSMDEYVEEVVGLATNITTSTSKWINESLTAAWPAIHNQFFQEQIENTIILSGHFDQEELIKEAEVTNAMLNKTGIPGYTYDMLIVSASKKRFQFHFESLSNDLYHEKGDFEYNTVLIRRPLNNSKNLYHVNIQDKMSRLRTRIESEMENLYDAKNVTEIAEGLKTKLGSFISENGFKGFAIARKWEKNIFKSCSAIDDVQYSKDSFSSIYNFTYQNSGNMFQHCETFNFYFFL